MKVKSPLKRFGSSSEETEVDFCILCDSEVAKESVSTFSRLMQQEGYSVHVSAQDKTYLKAQVIILYLTKSVLTNKNVVNRFCNAVRKNKNVVVLNETDEESGALIARRSRRYVNLELMLRQALPKASKEMKGYSPIPFRNDESYAKYVVREVLHMCDFKQAFHVVDSWPLAINKAAKCNSEARSWVFSNIENWKNDHQDKILAVTGSSGSGKTLLLSQYAFENKETTALHIFDRSNQQSRSAKACIRSLHTQLYNMVPQFPSMRAHEWMSIPAMFNKLISEPANKVVQKQMKKEITIILDGIDSSISEHRHALLHSLQTASLPKWLRIIVSSQEDLLSKHIMESKVNVLSLDDETVTMSDLTIFAENMHEDSLGSKESFMGQVLQNCKGNISYISLIKPWLLQNHDKAIPADIFKLYSSENKSFATAIGKEKHQKVLQLILASRVPLPISILRDICGVGAEELMETRLVDIVDRCVRFADNSILDWFESRKGIKIKAGHKALVEFCSKETSKKAEPNEESEAAERIDGLEEEKKDFAFRHIVYHMSQIEDVGGIEKLITNFDWLQKRVEMCPYTLVDDCEDLIHSNDIHSPAITTVIAAIKQAAPYLVRESRELAGQLIARISEGEESCISLLAEAKEYNPGGAVQYWKPLRSSMLTKDLVVNREVIENMITTEIHACAISHDMKYVACANQNGTVQLYSSPRHELLKVFEGHTDAVNSLDFSESNDKLVSGSDDSTAIIWDIASGCAVNKYVCGEAPINDARFSADGNHVVTGTNVVVKVWDVENKTEKGTDNKDFMRAYRKDQYGIYSLACSKNYSSTFAIGYKNGSIKLFSFEEAENEPETLRDKRAHNRSITAITFSRTHESLLISGSLDRRVCVWDFNKKELINCIKSAHPGRISDLSCNQNLIVSCSTEDDILRTWDIHTGKSISALQLESRGIRSCQTFPNEASKAIVCSNDYTLRVCNNITSNDPAVTAEKHKDWIVCVVHNPVKPEIATGSFDGTIRFWCTLKGTLLNTISPDGYAENLFVYSKDGAFILSRVGAWDAITGKRVKYQTIPKENRNKIVQSEEFHGKQLSGHENIIDTPEQGFGFTADSADYVQRILFSADPTKPNRERSIGVLCCGNSVHLLELKN